VGKLLRQCRTRDRENESAEKAKRTANNAHRERNRKRRKRLFDEEKSCLKEKATLDRSPPSRTHNSIDHWNADPTLHEPCLSNAAGTGKGAIRRYQAPSVFPSVYDEVEVFERWGCGDQRE
jgi:hypothetical protein